MNFIYLIKWNAILRFLLATFLGSLIGLERSFFGKQAGLRTFALVALGSSFFAYMGYFLEPENPGRVLANLIVGIGFLGGGLIFIKENKITGLTTAAALWVTTAIGGAVGIGYYLEAFFVTILTVIILSFLSSIEKLIRKK